MADEPRIYWVEGAEPFHIDPNEEGIPEHMKLSCALVNIHALRSNNDLGQLILTAIARSILSRLLGRDIIGNNGPTIVLSEVNPDALSQNS